jgi:hypothetical protein
LSSTVSQQNPLSAAARAAEWSTGWARVAEFLTAHPRIANHVGSVSAERMLCFVGARLPEPAAFMVDAAAACVASGGRVEPYITPEFGGVLLCFGPVRIQVYTKRHEVCATRVTGMVEQVEYTLTFDLPEQAPAVAS